MWMCELLPISPCTLSVIDILLAGRCSAVQRFAIGQPLAKTHPLEFTGYRLLRLVSLALGPNASHFALGGHSWMLLQIGPFASPFAVDKRGAS